MLVLLLLVLLSIVVVSPFFLSPVLVSVLLLPVVVLSAVVVLPLLLLPLQSLPLLFLPVLLSLVPLSPVVVLLALLVPTVFLVALSCVWPLALLPELVESVFESAHKVVETASLFEPCATMQLPKPAVVIRETRHLSFVAPPVHVVPAGSWKTIGSVPTFAGA